MRWTDIGIGIGISRGKWSERFPWWNKRHPYLRI